MFEPHISLIRECDDAYTAVIVALTPNNCYTPGRVVRGAPPGVVVVSEAIPFQLFLNHRGGTCLPVVTPVEWTIQNVTFSEARTSLVIFAVLDGKVVGSGSIEPTQSHRIAPAPANDPTVFKLTAPALAPASGPPPLTPGDCQDIVIACTPVGKGSGDPDQKLVELGITKDANTISVFRGSVRDEVARRGWKIDPRDVLAGPQVRVAESRASVFGSYHA